MWWVILSMKSREYAAKRPCLWWGGFGVGYQKAIEEPQIGPQSEKGADTVAMDRKRFGSLILFNASYLKRGCC
jgi:hypothetical protein